MKTGLSVLGWSVLAALFLLAVLMPPRDGSIRGEHFPESQEIYVIDGDTIVYRNRRIRLQGFDTPEIGQAECFAERQAGKKARDKVRKLIDTKRVRLVVLEAHDKYGRDLGRFYVDDVNIREILVEEGLAQIYEWGAEISWC